MNLLLLMLAAVAVVHGQHGGLSLGPSTTTGTNIKTIFLSRATAEVVAISTPAPAPTPPAWFVVANAEQREQDRAERARERGQDRAERAQERVLDKSEMSARFDQMSARFDLLELALSHVADAVVTQEVAARVDQCAPSVALHLLVTVPGDSFPCSAVPFFRGPAAPAAAASSTYFITCAHCLEHANFTLAVFLQKASYSCTVAERFSAGADPLDLAILHCQAVPVPPTTLSTLTYSLHQPAAILGFSPGEHIDPERTHVYNSKIVSPHIRFTRLANSLLLPGPPPFPFPRSPTNTTNTTDSLLTISAGAAPRRSSSDGYMDHSPEPGMSGGAVVDMRCGLLGISVGKSPWGGGGKMLRMAEPVVQRLQASVAQYEGRVQSSAARSATASSTVLQLQL